jgi:hypothetical protein
MEIPSHSTGEFYIHLSIPQDTVYLHQHWETWVTFKKGENPEGGTFFNQEYAVRVYIDTPLQMVKNQYQEDSSVFNLYEVIILIIIALTILLGVLAVWIYKKNNPPTSNL